MSHLRGLLPIAFATVLGVGNGIWIFGPAFKEQQQEKADQTKIVLEVAKNSEHDPLKSVEGAEATSSQAFSTKAASKPVDYPKSWRPSPSISTKEVENPSATAPEAQKGGQETSKSTP
ncbi:hypothetical protein JHW43_002774 [Diplocarpon mali]|nr:hypothetical protein JHW43_002774 [Diplocarpon mali]